MRSSSSQSESALLRKRRRCHQAPSATTWATVSPPGRPLGAGGREERRGGPDRRQGEERGEDAPERRLPAGGARADPLDPALVAVQDRVGVVARVGRGGGGP